MDLAVLAELQVQTSSSTRQRCLGHSTSYGSMLENSEVQAILGLRTLKGKNGIIDARAGERKV
eukprot:1373323-Prorocentrum_lima.AAC.1